MTKSKVQTVTLLTLQRKSLEEKKLSDDGEVPFLKPEGYNPPFFLSEMKVKAILFPQKKAFI